VKEPKPHRILDQREVMRTKSAWVLCGQNNDTIDWWTVFEWRCRRMWEGGTQWN